MLFNSIDFGIFLPVTFILYWFFTQRNLKAQNFLIVVSSYIFYGWWDWRFLILIFISSLVDFFVGILLGKESDPNRRKALLATSISVNLGILVFFKYYNFFAASLADAFTLFGTPLEFRSLDIILPVGVSFYTFQIMSYTIDVYLRKMEPSKDFIAYSAFVTFFPQLVAGPIERATHLLPQFYVKRNFDASKSTDGMRQMLWGLFKKVVIADNCARFANEIFNNSEAYGGSTILLGALFFTFQIYCDFSGYSDIAIGCAKLFGFELMQNFNYPYFSRDIAEFWRRWHISLSTWFRDYLYIPLGGSQGTTLQKVRNTFITFVVSGLWHGANWTFIAWGALNALLFIPLLLRGTNRNHLQVVAHDSTLPGLKDLTGMIFTFGMTVLAWIFFRATDIPHAIQCLTEIWSTSLFTVPEFEGRRSAIITLGLIMIFQCIEWAGRKGPYALHSLGSRLSKGLRWLTYFIILLTMYFFGNYSETIEFIYFQF